MTKIVQIDNKNDSNCCSDMQLSHDYSKYYDKKAKFQNNADQDYLKYYDKKVLFPNNADQDYLATQNIAIKR